MGLDLLIVTPIIIFTLLGFRDGIVRKIVGVIMTILALIAAKLFMADTGRIFVEDFGADPVDAPTYGFLFVFFIILLMQSLLYRLLARGYRIGGITDRILGSVIGFVQGVLIVSSFLVPLTLQDFPSQRTRNDSRLYKPVVNIAPRILDAAEAMASERIEELTKPVSPTMPAPVPRPQPR